MTDLRKEYEGGVHSEKIANELMKVNKWEVQKFGSYEAEQIGIIWRDRGVRECYARRNEFQVGYI